MRYTTKVAGVTRIKNMRLLLDAMQQLAEYEDMAETGCKGCKHELLSKVYYPCRDCMRGREDKYKVRNE